MVRQAPVICVMVPPIHLGEWSMALMLWLPFELLLLLLLPKVLYNESVKAIFKLTTFPSVYTNSPATPKKVLSEQLPFRMSSI